MKLNWWQRRTLRAALPEFHAWLETRALHLPERDRELLHRAGIAPAAVALVEHALLTHLTAELELLAGKPPS